MARKNIRNFCIIAHIDHGKLKKLDVNGNVEAIFFPEENDSTINKVVQIESSFLTADFLDGKLKRMKLWPESNGTATPLFLARKSILYLPKFQWYATLRPTSPEDIFVVSAEMEALMNSQPGGSRGSITPAPDTESAEAPAGESAAREENP